MIFCFCSVDADRIRKEYDESSSKLTNIQSRISSLTEKLKQDFGMEIHVFMFINVLLPCGYFHNFPSIRRRRIILHMLNH